MEKTKQVVSEKLKNPNFVREALLELYKNQTSDEQSEKSARRKNGKGFNKKDAGFLTYCAEYVNSGKNLSGKYYFVVKKLLAKYHRQIHHIEVTPADFKAIAKARKERKATRVAKTPVSKYTSEEQIILDAAKKILLKK